ncbi:MAG: AsmA family protein [Burkholderiaceae bacterium]|nr:AsmA family protein [Burkholderiaceae bacterium]
MTGKLRAFLSSKTVIAIVGLALAYLAAGFLLVPALVKWQAPKLVQEKLQHELKLGDVRFNPLRLTFEVDRLVLADAAGRSMLGLDHLLVDLEARSIVEWSWTFARVALTGPRVAIELDASGRHNFRGLLERLGSDEPPSGTPKGNPNGNPPPRLIVDQLRVEGGKLEYSDRALAEPRVLSLEPISVRIDAFSTLLDRKGRYAVSARSGAGEALELAGQLGLRPLTIEGTAEIKDLALQTIARALNRQLAVGANEGKFGLSTDYALSVAADGALGGRIGKASLSASALSLSARGSPEPMLAVESLGVEGVEVDLARRRIDIESIRLARGSVATLIDAGGVLNWSALVVPAAPATEEPARVDAPATVQEARSASAPASTPTPTPGPVSPPAQEKAGSGWQLAVAKVELLGIAASFDDRVDQLGAKTDQLDLGFAAEVQTGPSATKIRLDKLILALGTPQFADAATRFKAGEASLNIASIDLVLEQAASSVAAGPLELTSSSLEIEHGGRAARIANAAFGIAGIDLAGGAEPLALRGTGLSSTIGGVAVRAMGDPADVLELGSVKLSGAELDLAARFFKLDKLSIDGGSARALVDANGELNLARLARGRARANAAPDASPSGSSVRKAAGTAAGDRSRPWRLMLAETDVSGLALEFEDRSRTPALKVALEAIALRVTQFDTASKEPVAVDAKARVRSGGTIAARGKVSPDNGAAELKLAVSRLALAPVQPVLSQYALLTLGSGALSIDGRLRYGTGGVAPATLAYEGRFAIDSLLLEEIEPRRTFLAWKSVGPAAR